MQNHLKDKVALVTGSSRGIGAAIAQILARNGAKVVLHGRDEAALSSVRTRIEGEGGRAMVVLGDVTKFDEIEAMRSTIEQTFGSIDILVANAGGSYTLPAPIEDIPVDGWHASVEGNLTATFLTIKSFLPGMKKRKSGSILTLSSSAARKPNAQAPIPYSAAKAGVQMLTQSVAAQTGPFGIRVNCLAPATILTERIQQRIPEAQKITLADHHPIRRLGTPEDVAQAALFLLSDNAAWITGAILDVAGGVVMC